MKKSILVATCLAAFLLVTPAGWAIQPYLTPVADILKVKDLLDDPSPFFTKCGFFKQFMPQEAWDQVTYDVEEMKKAWEQVVGFRAPDVVGKIAPEIKPGRYTLEDKEKYPFKDLMTPYHYLRWNEPGTGDRPNHIGYFTEFEVVPTRQCYHALPVAQATLQNMGKTQQDSQGYIIPESFVAGFPFPRPSGDHKAMQIIYNYRKRKGDHDNSVMYDFSVGVNSSYRIDNRGMSYYYWLRTEGRVLYPPYGWIDNSARDQGEELVQLYIVQSPREDYGNVYHATFYNDPRKGTNLLVYVNFLRRIRKFSSTDSQDQVGAADIAFDDVGGFAQDMRPDRYPYEYRVIEEREFLVPSILSDGADYFDSQDRFKWKGRRFERRPVWVVEMKQLDSNYIYSRRVAYFDQETLLPFLWEMYDQKGRFYRSIESQIYLIEPMGLYNTRDQNSNWIDVHSTMGWFPTYPALWLSRDEVSLKNLMRQK